MNKHMAWAMDAQNEALERSQNGAMRPIVSALLAGGYEEIALKPSLMPVKPLGTWAPRTSVSRMPMPR